MLCFMGWLVLLETQQSSDSCKKVTSLLATKGQTINICTRTFTFGKFVSCASRWKEAGELNGEPTQKHGEHAVSRRTVERTPHGFNVQSAHRENLLALRRPLHRVSPQEVHVVESMCTSVWLPIPRTCIPGPQVSWAPGLSWRTDQGTIWHRLHLWVFHLQSVQVTHC